MPKAKDFFDSEEEFQTLLEKADSGARSETERDFVADMIEREDSYGRDVFISEAQIEWLRRLANS